MLTISEALHRIQATAEPLDAVPLPLDEVLGLTLAEDIVASDDSPPFDKALMDGYAVRAADISSGFASLKVIEVVTAGRVPARDVEPGTAIQIMTGAPIPQGADLVVKVEEALQDIEHVHLTTKSVKPGTNLIRRATAVRAGDVVLKLGMKLNGARIGALAELGRATVRVHRRPTVAVLATGDELVEISEKLGPGQIRNSNQSMLVAQLYAAGAIPVPLGIARDNRDDLDAKIQKGLNCDMLVLSGGVSAGALDLVPSVLNEAGVREVFHHVDVKPGKPIWFGLRNEASSSTCYVFGLPGNPVSSLVCCEIFVRTAIRRIMGESHVMPRSLPAKLEHDYLARANRPTYHPAVLMWTPEGAVVKLVPWHGSSDLCSTVAANAMVFLSGEAREYHAGEVVEAVCW